MEAFWRRADKSAMSDPAYAAIQAHSTHAGSGPGSVLDTSENDNFIWDHFETQLRISSELTPSSNLVAGGLVRGRPTRTTSRRAR